MSYRFLLAWGCPNAATQRCPSGSGPGQFNYTCGIAVDSSRNVYVADCVNNRIQKFDSSGNYLTQIGGPGQFNNPGTVAVDSSGNVYVSDINGHVYKFDSSGRLLLTWGSIGTGPGQFSINTPGIAVDSYGYVYVTDGELDRVQKFDSSGNFLLSWGSTGSGNGQFIEPVGIAVDASGGVYVADVGNSRVQKFDSSGRFLLAWGSPGSGPGQFSGSPAWGGPSGVAVDSSGHVYAADEGNNRIEKFDGSGNYITQWGCANPSTTFPACPPSFAPGQFNQPYGVAIDSLGNVYVTDLENNRVEKFEPVAVGPDPCASELAALDNFSWGDFLTVQEAEKAYRALVEALFECRRKHGLPPRGGRRI